MTAKPALAAPILFAVLSAPLAAGSAAPAGQKAPAGQAGPAASAAPAGAAAPAETSAGEDETSLIRQGVAAREQGDDRKALEVFRLAYERFRTPRARAQMALAEQALGLWAEAEANLDGALAKTDDPWIATNRQTLQQALTVIRQRVGTLEIISNAPETLMSVNGKPVGKLPLPRPLRVSAGSVTIQVQAPGFAPAQRSITIVAEQLARETFELVRLIVLSPPVAAGPTGPEVLPFAAGPQVGPDVLPIAVPTVAEPDQPRRDGADTGGPRSVPRAVFWSGVVATVVAAGLTTWSGIDVLRVNDRYKLEPTKFRYDDGVWRQHRTNWLMGTTVVLGVSTAVIGLFTTDWRSR